MASIAGGGVQREGDDDIGWVLWIYKKIFKTKRGEISIVSFMVSLETFLSLGKYNKVVGKWIIFYFNHFLVFWKILHTYIVQICVSLGTIFGSKTYYGYSKYGNELKNKLLNWNRFIVILN